MLICLKMTGQCFLAILFLLFLTGSLSAQTAPEIEQRLRVTTSYQEKQGMTYQLARLLFFSDPAQAARYAEQALKLSVQLHDQVKEAESAWLAADLAERAGHLPAAVSFYTQARAAAVQTNLPNLPLQAVEKLQTITAKQGNYKAAYQWTQEYNLLLQAKYQAQINEQNSVQTTTQATWINQRERERYILFIVLSGLAIAMVFFFYHRQRTNRRMRGEMAEKNAMIEEKRRRSEQLLLNILPSAVAAELTVRNKVAARRYEHATVMFIDFVSFTRLAEQLPPEALVAELDYCFSAFDQLISRKRIEKIKTVGDAYICASGLSDRNESPSEIIKVALQIQQFLQKLREKREKEGKPYFEARIGIHFGPVVAGIVGTKKFAYDIWGDTVNTAARMEEACLPGFVNVSGAARVIVETEFEWEYRGKIAAKNKGELEMYYATAR